MKRLIICILFIIFIGFSNVSGETTRLTKVYSFENKKIGYAELNNKDESLMITYEDYYNFGTKGVFWYKQGKKVKTINGIANVTISHDGACYSYTKNKNLYIFKENGVLFRKIVLIDEPESIVWSYDSKQQYVCIFQNTKSNIYCIDVQSGVLKQILRSQYYHPITTNDNNKLFLLEPKDTSGAGTDDKIIKYDLKSKKSTIVKLPFIKDLYIHEHFTVSPDGKLIIFESRGIVYVVNNISQTIIDTFELPGSSIITQSSEVLHYSWKSDGTYVIITYDFGTEYGIYKYTLPKY
jgi:Tol biopolymer transport system component